MKSLRQVGLGILTALFSTGLVFGSMLLALTEGGKHVALAPAQTAAPLVATPKPGEPTFTITPPPIPTETPTETAGVCENRPDGWVEREVQPGETLAELAQAYGISIQAMRVANCLSVDTLVGGSVLFVPPSTPTPTETPTFTPQPPTATKVKKESTRVAVHCDGPPSSWIKYTIKRGDTLFSIASTYGTTVAVLKAENCLTSDNIRTGQVIEVPNNPPRTPKRTPTRVPPPPRPTSEPPTKPPPIIPPTEPPPTQPIVTEPPPPPYP